MLTSRNAEIVAKIYLEIAKILKRLETETFCEEWEVERLHGSISLLKDLIKHYTSK
jgi:hypothetical protein